MKVTEHNVDADWQLIEIEALMALVKEELMREDNDNFINMFYSKIYGKLAGIKHDLINHD
jgi:hypothetical protein